MKSAEHLAAEGAMVVSHDGGITLASNMPLWQVATACGGVCLAALTALSHSTMMIAGGA